MNEHQEDLDDGRYISHMMVAVTAQQATITLMHADTILGQSRVAVEDGYDLKKAEARTSDGVVVIDVDTVQSVIPPWDMFALTLDNEVLDADMQPYADFVAREGDDVNALDWIYDELRVGALLEHAVREKAVNGRHLVYTLLIDREGALLLCFLDGNPVFRLQWTQDEYRTDERVYWYQPLAQLTCASSTVRFQRENNVCWSCELMEMLTDTDMGTFSLYCIAHPEHE
jgi:hypothetical protein